MVLASHDRVQRTRQQIRVSLTIIFLLFFYDLELVDWVEEREKLAVVPLHPHQGLIRFVLDFRHGPLISWFQPRHRVVDEDQFDSISDTYLVFHDLSPLFGCG